jgi:hypothetical protein
MFIFAWPLLFRNKWRHRHSNVDDDEREAQRVAKIVPAKGVATARQPNEQRSFAIDRQRETRFSNQL